MAISASRGSDADVIIVGAGIGGLTLALCLERAGIACRIYEAAAEMAPLGVGINVLPTPARSSPARRSELERRAVVTRESAFFNRFGQHVYSEPAGRWAGHDVAQLSIHRADLHAVLLAAASERIGADRIVFGRTCVGVDPLGDDRVRLRVRGPTGEALAPVEGAVAVACDGIHSALRKQLYPDEGPPRWSGVNMWRGVVPHAPFLSGATMVRAGWLSVGKMVIYPIRRHRRPRPAARQLGPSSNAPSPCDATGMRAAASTTSCRASRTGASTGSTSPR
jgi:2-polyprenyl-6-methoxyphenol hydroxylase-like FAD-dependent oxidoreductase